MYGPTSEPRLSQIHQLKLKSRYLNELDFSRCSNCIAPAPTQSSLSQMNEAGQMKPNAPQMRKGGH